MRQGPVRFLPCSEWLRSYSRGDFGNDAMAALIVTIMLIPQGLAYAMLAGMPPETGLYASILPILLYALFGSSRVLAVGPVAVVSLMTAASAGQIAQSGTAGYVVAALSLAFLSGLMLLAMGLLRMGFVAAFLSHPVIAGFITASGLLIAAGQTGPLTGIPLSGQTLPELVLSLWENAGSFNPTTAIIGCAAWGFLWASRRWLKRGLLRLGLRARLAEILARAAPVLAVALTTFVTWRFALQDQGVAIVGTIPQSLPPLTLPSLEPSLLRTLAVPALLISIIGFVESVSVASTLAARKRQRINPDQELIGLGAANLGAAFTGGFPVTGGFARSVVNADAGAATPAAGALTACGIALAALFLTPLLFFLPKATLAATIITAVLGLVNLKILRHAWDYSRRDFAAVAGTILVTLGLGVEAGVLSGVILSVGLHLARSIRPHVAEVGLVPGTQHFRNIQRHKVETRPDMLTLRIDGTLYFANTRYLEELILARTAHRPALRHVVLMCPAVNDIDMTALETLLDLNARLHEDRITLHLSEVIGPVMDRIRKSELPARLTGRIFLCQFDAWQALGADQPAETG